MLLDKLQRRSVACQCPGVLLRDQRATVRSTRPRAVHRTSPYVRVGVPAVRATTQQKACQGACNIPGCGRARTAASCVASCASCHRPELYCQRTCQAWSSGPAVPCLSASPPLLAAASASMPDNEVALSTMSPTADPPQPSTGAAATTPATTTTANDITGGVQLEIHTAADAAAAPAQPTDPTQRTWWEWMVMNVNSLGESLNPSYEYGKRAPPPPPTVPQGAVSVPMPRTLSGQAAERLRSAGTRNKTALLLRAFEGNPPAGHGPADTPADAPVSS